MLRRRFGMFEIELKFQTLLFSAIVIYSLNHIVRIKFHSNRKWKSPKEQRNMNWKKELHFDADKPKWSLILCSEQIKYHYLSAPATKMASSKTTNKETNKCKQKKNLREILAVQIEFDLRFYCSHARNIWRKENLYQFLIKRKCVGLSFFSHFVKIYKILIGKNTVGNKCETGTKSGSTVRLKSPHRHENYEIVES